MTHRLCSHLAHQFYRTRSSLPLKQLSSRGCPGAINKIAICLPIFWWPLCHVVNKKVPFPQLVQILSFIRQSSSNFSVNLIFATRSKVLQQLLMIECRKVILSGDYPEKWKTQDMGREHVLLISINGHVRCHYTSHLSRNSGILWSSLIVLLQQQLFILCLHFLKCFTRSLCTPVHFV